MRIKLGLKAWTTNLALIPQVESAFADGELDYVELFNAPGSDHENSKKWASLNVPFIVHAPHSMTGLNPAKAEYADQNIRLATEAYRLADLLRAPYVIFHPGLDGPIDESIRQLSRIHDPRMVVENKPYRGLNGTTCVGSTPTEMSLIAQELKTTLCLDFGHAIASACSHGQDPIRFLNEFLELSPKLFHLTDGDYSSELDHHYQYGKGTFPMPILLSLIPNGSMVTDEAHREKTDNIDEYIIDRNWMRLHDGHTVCSGTGH